MKDMKNQGAQELGRKSAKVRFKGMTKKQISERMKEVSQARFTPKEKENHQTLDTETK